MRYLAFDLGAESGRAIVGTLDDSRLQLQELYRFPNEPVRVGRHLYWDVLRLFREMSNGLRAAAGKYGSDLKGLAVDTWGVDFGLVDGKGYLLGNPSHYRDERTSGIMEEVFQVVPRSEVFGQTGIQSMAINTLYQLLAVKKEQPELLKQAQSLLMMPDLFKFFLTGVKESEFTISTTSQAFNTRQGTWANGLLESLGLPVALMPDIIQPGRVAGRLLPGIARATGIGSIPVLAVGSHDTASAMAAVPAMDTDYLFISSGTWSLVGAEVPVPVVTPETLEAEFSNEGCVGGTFRLLKNVTGLWLLQECRRVWAKKGEMFTYDEMSGLAREAKLSTLAPLVLPNHPVFLNPGDMPAAIQRFCAENGQAAPQTKGEIIKCVLVSLALEYRLVLEKLENILGRRLPVIHMVGGGIHNELLCQFAADACDRPVLAGPAEATATGNVLVQAMALGEIATLGDARNIVRGSFTVKTYESREQELWAELYRRYLDLKARVSG
ncbi:rhamnulokinase [Peptococcaceae bacterium CEB3]|nr:rhamnulokinase [Peptococcaceae bacterium CEB3]